MKIAVLGAGFTGLTAAFRLAQKGHQVFVFEKENKPGGLARGFKLPGWTWYLENNYHHFFASDSEAFKLIDKLGLTHKLFFKKPVTGVYYRPDRDHPCQKIFPLDTPLNFLLFPHLPPLDKIRSGLMLAYLKATPSWQHLEKTPAKEWIQKNMGQRAWQVLWQPLFINKFGGEDGQKVPASWFWARIKKRSQKLGYIEGGFQVLADKLVEEVKRHGGRINFNLEVKEISFSKKDKKFFLKCKNGNSRAHDRGSQSYHPREFAKMIVTLPTPVFLKITKGLPENYIKRLSSIKHLDALTLILRLKKPFLKQTYWLNICDSSFPFLLLVDHTNYISPTHYGGNHILYIGNYLPSSHPCFKKSKEQLLKIYTPYLQRINPNCSIAQLLNCSLFISPFAQPVFPLDYSSFKPDFTAPLPGLFLANQDLIYPWDRGVNYAIELGERVAERVAPCHS